MPLRWRSAKELVVPLAVLVVIVVIDLAVGARMVSWTAYAIAAVVASSVASVRGTAAIAGLALLLAVLSGWWNRDLWSLDWWVRCAMAAALGVLAIALTFSRVRRELALSRMTLVAETAQRALLQALPGRVGPVGLAARYVSAAAEASVGGDLYEVADSGYGVRVIVGDVRGKGLEAVQMAAAVQTAFRRAAFTEAALGQLADDLDTVVASLAGAEDFVTAVVCEFHDNDTMTVLNLGHHPPLLVTAAGDARLLDTGTPHLPLGIGLGQHGPADAVTVPWPRGSRVLLYTDGLVETRNRAGHFAPLMQWAPQLRFGTLNQALEQLLTRVGDHADHRLDDDMALVFAENRGNTTE